MTSEFVGVDGCRTGWVSVGFDNAGKYELKAFFTFDELVEYYHSAKLILVDMPIGLPEGKEERRCDPVVRRLLEHKGPTVFRAPTRQAVTHLANNPGDWEGTKCVQKRVTEKSLTNQTLAIMPKIIAVDRVMRSREQDANPKIREIHPEFCFWALDGERPMKFRKQKAEGIEERLRVLGRKGVEQRARDIFDEGCKVFLRKHVARDDILDALAAAVTAWQGSRSGRLQALPEEKDPQTDGKGLRMEMVFWHPQAQ